jgi:RNA polymerase sigma-70 factor (ECF subfamily)
MTEIDPQELVERVRRGEPEAFNEIVRLYHASLFRLANRVLRNRDDAQEVVQEAFLAAYQGLDRFAGRSNLRTWLLSITFNKSVDRIKRTTRDKWYISGELEKPEAWEKRETVENFTDGKANPEQELREKEMRESLDKALQQVPAESKAVFELRDIQGLSSKEVADALGISEGTVRVRLHRVRQFLMGAMQDFFTAEG